MNISVPMAIFIYKNKNFMEKLEKTIKEKEKIIGNNWKKIRK